MSIIKFIVLGIVLIVIVGALLWFLAIPSYFQNSSNFSYNAPYTSLTFRDGMNDSATLNFGDTEYTLTYAIGYLSDLTFIEQETAPYTHVPHAGDVYREFGIEIAVSKVGSDYISNYIVILVRPTVQNYMASLYYTKVNITLNEFKSVNISSGLVNETHEYSFLYTQVMHPSFYEPQLTIHTETQEKTYDVSASGSALWSSCIKDFNIETRVFKIESQYMVIYVKPLY